MAAYLVKPVKADELQIAILAALVWTPSWVDGRPRVAIEAGLCSGCAVCPQVCPAGAIVPAGDPHA